VPDAMVVRAASIPRLRNFLWRPGELGRVARRSRDCHRPRCTAAGIRPPQARLPSALARRSE